MADNDENLSHAEYWDERYSKTQPNGEQPTHEWFRSFSDLEEFLQKMMLQVPGRGPGDDPAILHLGCGDSVVPAELASRGYNNQLCVDFSSKVIEIMTSRYGSTPGLIFKQIDVRAMPALTDKSIDIAFDKGTLDAMIHGSPWSPPPDVKRNTERYLREVHRVLNDDGIFLYVTFRQAHFIQPLLDIDGLWKLDMEVLSGKGGAFDYYGWVIQKAR